MPGIFSRATKQNIYGRICLVGPSGSGKTFTALRLLTYAQAQAGDQDSLCVINSESYAVEKYVDEAPDGIPFTFDIATLTDFAPSKYTAMILAAAQAGYKYLIIDSLSHAWEGVGGALDQVDQASKGGKGNSFTAWKNVTPQHRRLIDAILRYPGHVVVTMRTKTEYVLEPNEHGKVVPRRVGLAPVQRKGMEYEFDLMADMDLDHSFQITKSRCPLLDQQGTIKPDGQFFYPFFDWLGGGATAPEGFYVRTEEDLRALEVKQHGAQKPAAPEAEPVASAQDLLAEMEKSLEGTDPKDPSDNPVTDEMLTSVHEIFEKLGWGQEQSDKILAKLGVSDWHDLKQIQLENLIPQLEAKLTDKEQEAAKN